MAIGPTIREYRRRMGWTQAQLAEKIGVTFQAVSGWERGEDRPTLENVTNLANLFGTEIEALTRDKRPRLSVVESFDPDAREVHDAGIDGPTVSSIAGRAGLSPGTIPEHDLRAGASYGGGYALVTQARKGSRFFSAESVRAEWGFPETWLRGEMRLAVETTDVLPIDGPSMSPDLEPGDRVLIDRSNRDPKQDAIFAIRDGESIIIKHVQLIRNSDPARIVCRSSNPKYDSFELILDGEQADIIGRVAARISKL